MPKSKWLQTLHGPETDRRPGLQMPGAQLGGITKPRLDSKPLFYSQYTMSVTQTEKENTMNGSHVRLSNTQIQKKTDKIFSSQTAAYLPKSQPYVSSSGVSIRPSVNVLGASHVNTRAQSSGFISPGPTKSPDNNGAHKEGCGLTDDLFFTDIEDDEWLAACTQAESLYLEKASMALDTKEDKNTPTQQPLDAMAKPSHAVIDRLCIEVRLSDDGKLKDSSQGLLRQETAAIVPTETNTANVPIAESASRKEIEVEKVHIPAAAHLVSGVSDVVPHSDAKAMESDAVNADDQDMGWIFEDDLFFGEANCPTALENGGPSKSNDGISNTDCHTAIAQNGDSSAGASESDPRCNFEVKMEVRNQATEQLNRDDADVKVMDDFCEDDIFFFLDAPQSEAKLEDPMKSDAGKAENTANGNTESTGNDVDDQIIEVESMLEIKTEADTTEAIPIILDAMKVEEEREDDEWDESWFDEPEQLWSAFQPPDEDKLSDDEHTGKEREKKVGSADDGSFFGLPDQVVQVYRSRGVKSPYPWQQECLSIDGVLQGRNLIYSAPTSGGKTFVSEILLLLWTVVRRKKGIIILPFVSIVSEKVSDLESLVEGSSVIVKGFYGNKSGDIPADPMIAVCTIEKANNIINRMAEEQRIEELGIVVCDELHMMGDDDRGYLLELMLTKLRYQDLFDLQIVGMSATLPNLKSISDWLDAALYITDFRPVPLTERIKVDDCLYDTNLGLVKKIAHDREVVKKDPDLISLLCYEVVEQNCSTLVFCSTKKGCETCANMIATSTLFARFPQSNSERDTLLEELRRTPGGLDPILEVTIPKGVAYHHAGLTMEERALIENAYRKGIISVLTATSTLAVGVNLPARRVILRSPYIGRDFLDPTRYKQMAGRAGRAGKDTSGESILVVKKNEKEKVRSMIHSKFPALESCLIETRRGLVRALLEAVASQLVQSVGDVEKFIKCTLLAAQRSYEDVHRSACKALEFLSVHQFIQWEDAENEGYYKITKLGSATVASGLTPEEGSFAFEELQKARKNFIMENELHLIYHVTPIYSSLEPDWNSYMSIYNTLNDTCKRVAKCVGVSDIFLIGCLQRPPAYQSKDKTTVIHRRFFSALILWNLTQNEMTVQEASQRFSVPRGSIQALQSLSSTFAHQVAIFCQKLSWWELGLLTSQFVDRLNFGVKVDVLPLCSIPELKGIRARVLFESGYKTVTSVALASPSDIEECLLKIVPFERKTEGGRIAEINAVKRLAKKIVVGAQEILARNEVIKSPDELISGSQIPDDTIFSTAPKRPTTSRRRLMASAAPPLARATEPSLSQTEKSQEVASEASDGQSSAVKVEEKASNIPAAVVKYIPRQYSSNVYPTLCEANFEQLSAEWKMQKEFSLCLHMVGHKPEILVNQKKKRRPSSTGNKTVLGFGISLPNRRSFYLSMQTSETKKIELIKEVMLNQSIRKIIADAKNTLHILAELGFKIDGPVFDPLIAAWLLDPEVDAEHILKIYPTYSHGKKSLPKVSQEADAICAEAMITLEVMQNIGKVLVLQQLLPAFIDVEMEITKVLYDMERKGLSFSLSSCQSADSIIQRRIFELEQQCSRMAGRAVKLTSPKDIHHVLFDELGLNPDVATRVKYVKGKQIIFYSTSESVLQQLSRQHPLPGIIMEHRKLMHLKRSVVKNLIHSAKPHKETRELRIFPTFKQTASSIGKVQVVEPNLQSLPNGPVHIESDQTDCDVSIKSSFVAPQDCVLLEVNYPFLDLRILAHISQDGNLSDVIREGGDVILGMASKWLSKGKELISKDERYRCKRIIDSIVQGQDVEYVCQLAKINKGEAIKMVESLKDTFPAMNDYFRRTIVQAQRTGYISTLSGRRRYLATLQSKSPFEKIKAERQAISHVIQGSSSDMMKQASIRLFGSFQQDRDFGSDARLVLMLHSSFLFEVPSSKLVGVIQRLKALMESVFEMNPPLLADFYTGRTWGNMTYYDMEQN